MCGSAALLEKERREKRMNYTMAVVNVQIYIYYIYVKLIQIQGSSLGTPVSSPFLRSHPFTCTFKIVSHIIISKGLNSEK